MCRSWTTDVCGALAMNYDVSWVARDYSGIGNQFGIELIGYSASSWAFGHLCDFRDG